MRFGVFSRISYAALITTAVLSGKSSARAAGVNINDYHQVGSFNLPAGGSVFSSLGTGNLAVLSFSSSTGQSQVLTQNGIDSSSFTATGNLPTGFAPSYGPSFFTTAPNGLNLAAGDGSGDIAVFNPAAPAAATLFNIGTPNDFDAKWASNTLLAITDPNGVDILNTTTGKVTKIISDLSGYSGGIAFDSAGNLYTGDGYFTGPGTTQSGLVAGASQTGLIKEFSAASWQGSLLSGTSIDFESSGIDVAQLLSANSLGFDNSGNFFVGGADSFGTTGNYGYEALVSASAVQSAIVSQQSTLITGSSAREIADPYGQYDPGYFSYNDTTSELYLQYPYDEGTSVRIYSAVPEPGSIVMLVIGASGFLIKRRRKAVITTAACVCIGLYSIPRSVRADFSASSFATTVVSADTLGSNPTYSDPTAILGQPPLSFNNSANPNVVDGRTVKIVEPPVNYDLNGSPVLAQLPNYPSITQVTVQMGAPITHDPNHPYGDDLIVFGNSFFLSSGTVNDNTNLNNLVVNGIIYAHPVQVSVSPDNSNWFSFGVTAGLQPYNAYKWNDTAASWTNQELDPTLPLNPSIYTTSFAGQSAASILDAYGNSAGGTAFNLQNAIDANGNTLFQDGYSSIDYVRVSSTVSGYSVVSGIAAVSVAQPTETTSWVPEPGSVTPMMLGGLSLIRRMRA